MAAPAAADVGMAVSAADMIVVVGITQMRFAVARGKIKTLLFSNFLAD